MQKEKPVIYEMALLSYWIITILYRKQYGFIAYWWKVIYRKTFLNYSWLVDQ